MCREARVFLEPNRLPGCTPFADLRRDRRLRIPRKSGDHRAACRRMGIPLPERRRSSGTRHPPGGGVSRKDRDLFPAGTPPRQPGPLAIVAIAHQANTAIVQAIATARRRDAARKPPLFPARQGVTTRHRLLGITFRLHAAELRAGPTRSPSFAGVSGIRFAVRARDHLN